VSVDLPAFGAPSTATTAQRCSATGASLSQKCFRGRALRLPLGAAFTSHWFKSLYVRINDEMRRVLWPGLGDLYIAQMLLLCRSPFL
jgi:hypothetical protein